MKSSEKFWGKGRPSLRLELGPTGLRWHPEDVLGDVFVAVLRGVFAPLVEHCRTAFFEGVGDVLQEDEAKDNVLVLSCVHRAAQGVCHPPQLGLVAGGGPAVRGWHPAVSLLPWASSGHGRDLRGRT